MALTRKFLSAMGIEADKVDQIIEAHTETVDALKEQINSSKDNAESLKALQTELDETKKSLDDANKQLEKFKSGDYEKKYTDLKTEYDAYKADVDAKAVKSTKTAAYRKFLLETGISEKRVDSVMKVSDSAINELKLDKEGKIEDADKLAESVKSEWADFIQTTYQKGADVSTPPENKGGESKSSRAAELVAQYRNEHYGNPTKEE